MREILFRGKRLDNGKWEYGDLVHDDRNGVYVFPNDAENLYLEYEVAPDTVGQYTGLTDKNGTKIFDGDIIALNPRRYANKRVFYYSRCASFNMTSNLDVQKACEIQPMFDDDCDRFEVIGNIHDNPELMKGDKK